jgi:MYXO-CTERM domain-containing protein
MTATPAVGDINGDHMLEVVEATREGFLYAWTTTGSDTGVVAGESFHHDNANTGNYATTLDQGVLEAAKTPLDCTLPDAGAPDAAVEGGKPDAGRTDAGKKDAGQRDAGKGADAGHADASTGEDATASGGGCGCVVGRPTSPTTSALSIGMLGALAAVRRRRRRRY